MSEKDQSGNVGCLPGSLNELERFVQKTLEGFSHQEECAAVYIRLSVVDPNVRSYSLEYQPDQAEEYARSMGWKIVGVYSDPDRTGRNSKRPGLQQMVREIKSGKVTVIVVHRLDRLYRNLESLLRFLRFLKRYRVRLVSVTEQIDTDSWWGRLVLYVLGALAEMYVWQTSVRVREVKAETVRRGLHNGLIPIGYCNGLCSDCTDLNGPEYCPMVGQVNLSHSQRGRIPIPHPVDQYAVQLIHELYSQGWSYREIADHLNRNRFRLPSGLIAHFRTKGIRNDHPDRPFNRDSIRGIVSSPFYAGLVARYATRPLNMDDEHLPDVTLNTRANSNTPNLNGSKRSITELHPGKHEAIISVKRWEENQQHRKQRGSTWRTSTKATQEYMLTGVGFCWECYEWDRRQARLRGVKGLDYTYYRCATVQDQYSIANRKITSEPSFPLEAVKEETYEEKRVEKLIDRHRASLSKDVIEQQIAALINDFIIPESWYEIILAYYLSDDGMSKFELEGHNLRKELSRQRELFNLGHITQAEYEQVFNHIDRELQKLAPSSKSDTRGVKPILKDFCSIWKQMNLTERRALLKIMFLGLYFDSQSKLRKVAAQSPFDKMLRVPKLEG